MNSPERSSGPDSPSFLPNDCFIRGERASLNFVEECNSYTFMKKRKSDIKKFSFYNAIVIGTVVAFDFFKMCGDGHITEWAKTVVLVICICNLLHFMFTYLKLARASQEQRVKIKNHFCANTSPKQEDEGPVEMNNLATPSPQTDVSKTPPHNNMTGEFSSFETPTNHTLTKYKNKMFSQANDLVKYLCDYKQAMKDELVLLSRDSSMPSGPFDFWSPENRKDTSPNSLDVSPLLRTLQYQTACKKMLNTSAFWGGQDSPDGWSQPNVKWICNLRSWLSEMVLKRLVEEIETVNRGLQKEGMGSYLVGTVGLDALVNTANNHVIVQKIPNISFLVPFLEISTNQQYVVQRIRDLAKGSSMNCFNWRSGGNYEDKLWESHLLTDAELVMHLFMTYLDSRLPLLAERPSAKPFSSQYFARSPNSPKKTNLAIVQDNVSPPHYQLMINNSLRDIPHGRNNLFWTLVQFLCCVKKYEHGSLGNINWGRGGLNMLSIIENTDI
ncbi:transmembrane protein 209 isoform X2 [Cimex lectularius]|uniref:Transmembrane protein 209 n=1 Tax=Cimex lectularius TaxID=79782 RepID=A0A8I6S6I2_CIMLE|nr:transmembrane protein 209 isoform X2 [Cimex lectularius]